MYQIFSSIIILIVLTLISSLEGWPRGLRRMTEKRDSKRNAGSKPVKGFSIFCKFEHFAQTLDAYNLILQSCAKMGPSPS